MASGESGDERVRLNIGGKIFQTTKQTLCKEPNTFFASLLATELVPSVKDESGAYMIDRDSEHFGRVLSYLRTGYVDVSDRSVLPAFQREAEFYGIASLVKLLQEESGKVKIKELVSVIREDEVVYIVLPTSDSDYDVTRELFSARHFPQWELNLNGVMAVKDKDRETILLLRNHLVKAATELGFQVDSNRENECTLVRETWKTPPVHDGDDLPSKLLQKVRSSV